MIILVRYKLQFLPMQKIICKLNILTYFIRVAGDGRQWFILHITHSLGQYPKQNIDQLEKSLVYSLEHGSSQYGIL